MKIRFVLVDAPPGSRVRGLGVYRHPWSDECLGQLIAVPVTAADEPMDTDFEPENMLSELAL